MNNDDIIHTRNGNRVSVQVSHCEIKGMDEWLDGASNASGQRVECQTEDWPGSTPNPILESNNEHFSTHATKEVLVIGHGADIGTQFCQVYFTHGLRERSQVIHDDFETGRHTKIVQGACVTILDTLQRECEVNSNSKSKDPNLTVGTDESRAQVHDHRHGHISVLQRSGTR
jgi:hypothetical protein